jgi:hypothetical protein
MKHPTRGDRKTTVAREALRMAYSLAIAALLLAAWDHLHSEAVRVLESFATFATFAVAAYMGGNAAEHKWGRKTPEEGDS